MAAGVRSRRKALARLLSIRNLRPSMNFCDAKRRSEILNPRKQKRDTLRSFVYTTHNVSLYICASDSW